MEFIHVNGVLTAFEYRGAPTDAPIGEFVRATLPLDDGPYFYFRPAVDAILSCRECRLVSEKLAELNVAAHNTSEVL